MPLPAVPYSTTILLFGHPNTPQRGDLIVERFSGNDDVTEKVLIRPGTSGGFVYFDPATDALVVTNAPRFTQTEYTANGAIALTTGTHVISKTSAAAMTVAAPTAAQNGTRLAITAGTNFAHVITFTGSTLLDGTTGANQTATLTAFIGSTIVVEACATKWLLISSSNVTSITA
jgi:hypothetical protein